MTTGAVIVTHNSERVVRACIESVVLAGVRDIVIVDSKSTDRTLESVRGRKVRIVALSENKGFGCAANKGAYVLNTDYVLFLNPDAQLSERALASMVRVMESSQQIGVVGGMLVNAQKVPENHAFGDVVTPMTAIVRRVSSVRRITEPTSVGWVSGGALLIRRQIFTSIGGFDEDFFLYWEDVDLCRRVKQLGFEVYIDPHAHVSHDRGASSSDEYRKTALYDASANRYFQKYYPPLLCYLYHIARKIYRLFRPLAY